MSFFCLIYFKLITLLQNATATTQLLLECRVLKYQIEECWFEKMCLKVKELLLINLMRKQHKSKILFKNVFTILKIYHIYPWSSGLLWKFPSFQYSFKYPNETKSWLFQNVYSTLTELADNIHIFQFSSKYTLKCLDNFKLEKQK